MSRIKTTLAVAAALSGCSGLAKPSVRTALIEAGARPQVADCMAERMTDRLSIAQLRKLERVKAAPGEKTSNLSALDIIERVNRIGDPEVVSVTMSAGAVCSVAS